MTETRWLRNSRRTEHDPSSPGSDWQTGRRHRPVTAHGGPCTKAAVVAYSQAATRAKPTFRPAGQFDFIVFPSMVWAARRGSSAWRDPNGIYQSPILRCKFRGQSQTSDNPSVPPQPKTGETNHRTVFAD